jgi:ATP-dependent DNA helicase RecQ
MKFQYKAAYLSKSVFDQFRQLMEKQEVKYKLLGLWEHVTTFDVITQFNLENPTQLEPLLAVANNLICRGTPTIASNYISQNLDHFNNNFTPDDFFKALHLIDNRPDRPSFYSEDLDSQFEAAFLNSYLSTSGKVLTQLFQHQRDLSSITQGHHHGRTDFSFESPYFKLIQKEDIYHKVQRLKEKEIIRIVEIDGARYHQNILVDDQRDFETARFGADTNRIREHAPVSDMNLLVDSLRNDPYIKNIYNLVNDNQESTKNLQNFVLIPIAIARLQKLINQFLISNPVLCTAPYLKIAILERDLPCGNLAIDDLNQLYHHLNGLTDFQFKLPEIIVDIFSEEEYGQIPGCPPASNPSGLDFKAYDLVIDHAILWRTGIFEADKQFSNIENAAVIRSSHFTEQNCENSVYSAKPIFYRNLTREIGNENHAEIKEAIPFIEYFLQNIFFKSKFRKGQLPILNRALKNKSVIGLLPTGGGKSLTYQLASLLQPGITIVIDPIRSLMVDQYESLISIGIDKCDFINSILNQNERNFVQNNVLPKAKVQFIFCSPERLVIKEFREALQHTTINGNYFTYCVIDEAHCVSEWGHDFRTPYLNLGENAINHCKTFTHKNIPIFGLTATASFDVLADIERELKIAEDDGNAIVRYENTVRDEIHYEIKHIIASSVDNKPVDAQIVGSEKQMQTAAILNNFLSVDNQLSLFDSASVINKILRRTYQDFLPEFEKNAIEIENFVLENSPKLMLGDDALQKLSITKNNKYPFGIITFCPHTGKPNLRGGRSELGVLTYFDYLRSNCPQHKFGYFIGSGDENQSVNHDKASFENLKKFKDNEISVMVATKAFGMGIDKSNIRHTIHINIPSSIEAFVQESGRAGRDGKTALATVLFNDQTSRDRDVLMSFHRNSFKGADKERSVLWELRNGIYHPTSTTLSIINEKINEELNSTLILELGRQKLKSDFSSFIFVKNEDNENVGWINFENKTLKLNSPYELSTFYLAYFHKFIEQIPEYQSKNKDEIRNLLIEKHIKPGVGDGIEKRIKNGKLGELFTIDIPFKNAFYAKADSGLGNIIDDFAFDQHFKHFASSDRIKHLFKNNLLKEVTLESRLKEAVQYDKTFEEFIKSLNLNSVIHNSLIDTVKLRVRYYIPRNTSDTAKAIYRLASIGIIDTYTIDYLNKIITINFSKKSDETYFNNFSNLVGRYTSPEEANKIVDRCRDHHHNDSESTAISKVLEHLTLFIYNKIADKRLRAIDDMVNLCKESVKIADRLEQSERIKENIYYYFNAKYTRSGNIFTSSDGSTMSADLNEDAVENLSINETIWKYIESIIPYDDNQGIINNLKHLRGATMRMLRSRTGAPQYNTLKAFSLFILSRNIPDLLEEAQIELSSGIVLWEEIAGQEFHFEEFYQRFKKNVENHLGPKDDTFFGNPEDYFLISKNLTWLTNFNLKFSKTN